MAPLRTCIVCRTKGEKENFIKIVKNKNGLISIERSQKLEGRGAYICKNIECAKKCQKTRALNRVFKTEIPQNLYEDIANVQ